MTAFSCGLHAPHAILVLWLAATRLKFHADSSPAKAEPIIYLPASLPQLAAFTPCAPPLLQVAVNTTLSVGASGLSCLALAVLLGEAGECTAAPIPQLFQHLEGSSCLHAQLQLTPAAFSMPI